MDSHNLGQFLRISESLHIVIPFRLPNLYHIKKWQSVYVSPSHGDLCYWAGTCYQDPISLIPFLLTCFLQGHIFMSWVKFHPHFHVEDYCLYSDFNEKEPVINFANFKYQWMCTDFNIPTEVPRVLISLWLECLFLDAHIRKCIFLIIIMYFINVLPPPILLEH